MPIKSVPAWLSFQYKEVFRITKWKDGCIYRTEPTGLYVKSPAQVNPQKYTLANLSYSGKDHELNVVSDTNFQ